MVSSSSAPNLGTATSAIVAEPPALRPGLVVAGAATGLGLLLGILYAWSVIKGGIPDSWAWSNADKALPYAIACFVFSLTMVPAGVLQDRIGPRAVALIGGVLTGIGFIVAGLCGSSLTGFVLGFGVVAGIGIGFGYVAAEAIAIGAIGLVAYWHRGHRRRRAR